MEQSKIAKRCKIQLLQKDETTKKKCTFCLLNVQHPCLTQMDNGNNYKYTHPFEKTKT